MTNSNIDNKKNAEQLTRINKKIKDTIKQSLIERDGQKCAITGEEVTNPDELTIDHLIPILEGGSHELDNLILVKRDINSRIGNDYNKRTKLLFEQLKKREDELNNRERSSFEREKVYRKQIEQQESELDKFRLSLKKEQAERESFFEREMQEQKKRIKRQEIELQEQLRLNQQNLENQINQVEEQKTKLTEDIQAKERELLFKFEELEKEKEKYKEETRKKIEIKSGAYVNEALTALGSSATKYHEISRNWSIAGLLALVAGIFTAFYFGINGLTPIKGQTSIEWPQVVFFGFKGVIVIGLFIALAKYCFMYGQSFMHESLKNSERKHAINFGKFYLESYGADAEWSQVKEAFEHWNISSNTAFSSNDSQKFDPKIFEQTAQLVNAIEQIKLPQQNGSVATSKA